jgi:hypothetical protein
MATLTLQREGREILSTRALCLDVTDGTREIQFEYETGEQRTVLENLLREVAKGSGYAQSAAPSVGIKPAPSKGPVLTRDFRTPSEFMRTYLGSIEAGILNVPSKEALPRGTAVNVRISVGGGQSVRLAFSGYVRLWKDGLTEVEIEELSGFQREKIEQLVRKLVEKKSEAKWSNKRRPPASERNSCPAT